MSLQSLYDCFILAILLTIGFYVFVHQQILNEKDTGMYEKQTFCGFKSNAASTVFLLYGGDTREYIECCKEMNGTVICEWYNWKNNTGGHALKAPELTYGKRPEAIS